ncbi:INO80 complex subunit E, partial [Drosophila busckii]|uniref:INO80 complex subunit E n=1 Tax=Drosophila busckii TaxID=30019 RepID=UPI001432DF99
MLDGWYCRSLANEKPTENSNAGTTEASATAASSSASTATANQANIDYKERYTSMKRKLKFLIYENEYFQDLLHTNQRRLLKVSRDRSFLIDRLLLYEKPAKDSSDSDATDSSNSDVEPTTSAAAQGTAPAKDPNNQVRRKHKEKPDGKLGIPTAHPGPVGGATRGRRRKILTGSMMQRQPTKKQMTVMPTMSPALQQHQQQPLVSREVAGSQSTAELARQLQERRPTPIELMSPECTSATVPATMLSDESPSKIYPNESLQHLMMEDDSPSHVAAEECVPMVYL